VETFSCKSRCQEFLVWGQLEPGGATPTGGTLTTYSGQTAQNPTNPLSPAIYQPQNLELPSNWDHWVQEPPYCSPISGNATITNTIQYSGYTDYEAGNFPTTNNEVITWGCNTPLGKV
jgi:hypothetical protein